MQRANRSSPTRIRAATTRGISGTCPAGRAGNPGEAGCSQCGARSPMALGARPRRQPGGTSSPDGHLARSGCPAARYLAPTGARRFQSGNGLRSQPGGTGRLPPLSAPFFPISRGVGTRTAPVKHGLRTGRNPPCPRTGRQSTICRANPRSASAVRASRISPPVPLRPWGALPAGNIPSGSDGVWISSRRPFPSAVPSFSSVDAGGSACLSLSVFFLPAAARGRRLPDGECRHAGHSVPLGSSGPSDAGPATPCPIRRASSPFAIPVSSSGPSRCGPCGPGRPSGRQACPHSSGTSDRFRRTPAG